MNLVLPQLLHGHRCRDPVTPPRLCIFWRNVNRYPRFPSLWGCWCSHWCFHFIFFSDPILMPVSRDPLTSKWSLCGSIGSFLLRWLNLIFALTLYWPVFVSLIGFPFSSNTWCSSSSSSDSTSPVLPIPRREVIASVFYLCSMRNSNAISEISTDYATSLKQRRRGHLLIDRCLFWNVLPNSKSPFLHTSSSGMHFFWRCELLYFRCPHNHSPISIDFPELTCLWNSMWMEILLLSLRRNFFVISFQDSDLIASPRSLFPFNSTYFAIPSIQASSWPSIDGVGYVPSGFLRTKRCLSFVSRS